MRRLDRRIWGMIRRHVALTLGLGTATLVVVVGLSFAALTGAFNSPTPAPATYSFTADWTLLDLQRHIEAGEVATISLVTAPSGAPGAAAGTVTDVLAARTTGGQWVRVTLAVSPEDALIALRSLGFGRLIAADSVTAAASDKRRVRDQLRIV